MFAFLTTFVHDLHPLLVHFPIVFFTLSFHLALAARIWPHLRQTEWLLFLLGTISAPVVVVTGLVAHLPYEEV